MILAIIFRQKPCKFWARTCNFIKLSHQLYIWLLCNKTNYTFINYVFQYVHNILHL